MARQYREPEGEKYALGALDEQAHWQAEYHRIVDKVRVGLHGAGSEALANDSRTVGERLPRNDVLYKVRGRARYAANIPMDEALHCRFVRSPHPHARIARVDVSGAWKIPGVKAILTADDIPEARLLVGTIKDDTPILAKHKVRYAGEPVVAIAADSVAAADEACLAVVVDYEPLPLVLSPRDALAPGAEKIDDAGNIIADLNHRMGDIDRGFAEADVVLERTYTIESMDHCFLEPPSGLAFVDPDGVLTVMVCTQYPHYHHKQIARVTGRPMDKVRVVQTVVGGAFGGKMDNTVECAIAFLTLKTGVPVRMVYTREEVFVATTKRHAMEIRLKLGATRDGRLTALEADYLSDGGAYRSYSNIVGGRCVIHTGMPYRIPNQKTHYVVTLTNYAPSGAMRSFGVVKVAFALESLLNELAERLDMSPFALRRKNALVDGDRTNTGQLLLDVGFTQSLDALEPIYEERRRALAADRRPGRRGLGIACLGYGIGYSGVRNPSTARLRVERDGSVVATCGTPDLGQGSDMSLAQVAAQAAGVSVHRVRVLSGDSTKTDDSGPTSASRTTYFSGNAALIAGRDFRARFEHAMAELLGVARESVRLADDRVSVGKDSMAFEQACALLEDRVDSVAGYGKFDPPIEADILTFKGNPYATYTYATHLVEVSVDEELGQVDVERVWTAHDAGTVVNPLGAEGQVEGGVAMGIGQALWERMVRKDGVIANPHYRDYLLPGAKDVPLAVECKFVQNQDRTGPYGARGVAEVSLIPIPAAIGSAIADAVGIRPAHLPMDAQYLWRLLEEKRAG
ncbi:MAG: xanthine dehydrogenase family protein [Burkholderiales bacterium]|nr:xanthine dehydrogenase family protein [Burkholderiales bacterium]